MGSERMGTALDSSTTDKVATEFKEGGADILHTKGYRSETEIEWESGTKVAMISWGILSLSEEGKLDLANLIKDKWPNKRTTLRLQTVRKYRNKLSNNPTQT